MKIHVITSMAFCILLTTACSLFQKENIEPTGSDGSANYPFLAVGHELHYVYNGSTENDSMSIKIISNPETGTYKAEVSYEPYGSPQVMYYHASGRGLFTSTSGDYMQYDHWWFSLDAALDEFWSRDTPGFLYTYQLVAKNVTVTTPILHHTYINCYKITGKKFQGLGIDTIYFRPDIGIVFFDGVETQYELAHKNFVSRNP